MAVIKTKYEQTKMYDTPVCADVNSVQDIFSVEAIEESGIFTLPGGNYSKTYMLSDINFAGVTDEEQKSIIVSFSKVLKGIPCRFSYSIANEHVDEKSFHEKVLYKKRGDADDRLRDSYNQVIREKLSDAKQGLYQTIYLTLTISADGVKDAKATFMSIEGAIRSAFIGLGLNGMQGSSMKSLSIDERMQLMCKAFEKTICTETRRVIKMTPGKLDDYEDDYKNELRIDILREIHKFNNPAYLDGTQTYSIDAFVRARTRGVTKKIIGMKRERKEYQMKRESHVKKIMAALHMENGSTVFKVEDIFKNQHLANDSMELSMDQIWDVMAAMEDASYFEDLTDYEANYKEKKFDSVEQQEIIKEFMKDMSAYPEYEMYIYRQSLRLRLDETTNKEIACDRRLIDMCKAAPEACDKVIYERIVIERPKSGIAPNSEFEEYVSTTYIETIYRRIDRNIRSAFVKKSLDEKDMLAILNHLINM